MGRIADIEGKLGVIVEEYMRDQMIPGIGVGVVLNGELVYTKGFGVKNVDTGEHVTSTSLFHMASVSKTFVATAIMQLVERRALDINKPVVEYLPYFKLRDDRYKKITVQNMLSHVSGMPDVFDYECDKPYYEDDALEKYTKSISDFELMWEPGEQAAYSNAAYEVLGDVIGKVSGTTFENYVKQNILNPLGMYESSFLNKELSRVLLSSPHVRGEDFNPKVSSIFPYNRMHAPSSTLCSNPVEMCNYAIAYLNRGKYNGRDIINQATYENMTKSHISAWRNYEIGLSWFIEDHDGVRTISHSGGDTGFGSNLIIQPERGIAVVVMCNCDYADMTNLSKAILDIVNGHDVKLLKLSICPTLYNSIKESGIEGIRERFTYIKENEMDKYVITEGSLNSFGYSLVEIGKLDEAIEILHLAIDEFPEEANLYDSIGEFYLKKGKTELARHNYQKSLDLNPGNIHAADILKRI